MKPHFGGENSRKRNAAPRRKVARKQVKRPGSRAPRHKRPTHGPVDSGFSPMTVFLLIIALGLGGLMAMVLMPKGLDSINGYPPELVTEKPRNLLPELQGVITAEGDAPSEITLTEAELNRYLSERVGGEQSGPLGPLVKFQGVFVDLEPNSAEIFVVRKVAGLPFAVSQKMVRKKSGYADEWDLAAGSLGRITLSGKRQFKPIADVFLRVGRLMDDEIDVINMVTKVEIGDDQVTLGR